MSLVFSDPATAQAVAEAARIGLIAAAYGALLALVNALAIQTVRRWVA